MSTVENIKLVTAPKVFVKRPNSIVYIDCSQSEAPKDFCPKFSYEYIGGVADIRLNKETCNSSIVSFIYPRFKKHPKINPAMKFKVTMEDPVGNKQTQNVEIIDNINYDGDPRPDNKKPNARVELLQFVSDKTRPVILDGTESTDPEGKPLIYNWQQTNIISGQQPVTINNSDKAIANFMLPADVKTGDSFSFKLTVTDPEGLTDSDTTVVTYKSTIIDPRFPVNVDWYYDAKQTLSKDIRVPKNRPHPDDPVMFSSGASGVDYFDIKSGKILIQSGGGNGRVYWNYHEIPQMVTKPEFGFNLAFTCSFILSNQANLSIKDGNHGTNGWSLDGRLVFGGFGLSLHRNEVQSKVEYYHNKQGNEQSFSYPNGRSLSSTRESKVFLTIRTDRIQKEVVLEVWIDFGDGQGWIKCVNSRKWNSSNWNPSGVPDGKEDSDAIRTSPHLIKRHHIWTRNNGGNDDMPVWNLQIGLVPYIA